MLEILETQIPFIEGMCAAVIANFVAGAIKHNKMQDFNFKELVSGGLKFAGILFAILCLVIGVNVYEPLYVKFAVELETVKEVIVAASFLKGINLVKEYFNITDEDIEEYVKSKNQGQED